MASQWHYKRDDEQHGPFTSVQLKELAASGQLVPSDLVWKEGVVDWLPASNLNGLFPGKMEVMPPTVAPVLAVPSVTKMPPIPPSGAAKTGPPPIPPKMKTAPPPVPPKSQPPSVPSASSAGSNPFDALAAAGATARNLTGSAAARAKQINAAIPNRITVGKFALPKKVVVGAAAAILLVIGATIFWPKSKEGNSSATAQPKSFKEQIAGEWIATTGDGTMEVKSDKIILGGMGLSVAQMIPYQTDEAIHGITFKMGDNTWNVKLDDDHRLYAQQQGRNEVVAFAREYKGGWHQPGELDRGNRSPGLEAYDHPQDDSGGASAKKEPWGAGLPRSSSLSSGKRTNGSLHTDVDTSNLHGSTHVHADGSVDGTVTGDGFSAHSHLNRDGSGEGEYKVNGQTVKVKRAADGSTTVQQ
jgi:hypothetical protein